MQCPHCGVAFHDQFGEYWFSHGDDKSIPWKYKSGTCPACNEIILVAVQGRFLTSVADGRRHFEPQSSFLIWPRNVGRGAISSHVPTDIANDYKEATAVLLSSAKASAALSRRCLQAMLHAHGFKAANLAKEIELFVADPKTPSAIASTVDAIRGFGNFSAHPMTDVTALQIIDVQPHEAEYCLDILEALFDHFYEKPAKAAAMKAALDAKLAQAGKPPSK